MKKIPLTPFYPLLLLLIPWFGMQFSSEVNWSLFDFVIMGVLLSVLGLAIHFISKTKKTIKQKVVFISFAVFLFLLLWAELAVGIIGTPFAGS